MTLPQEYEIRLCMTPKHNMHARSMCVYVHAVSYANILMHCVYIYIHTCAFVCCVRVCICVLRPCCMLCMTRIQGQPFGLSVRHNSIRNRKITSCCTEEPNDWSRFQFWRPLRHCGSCCPGCGQGSQRKEGQGARKPATWRPRWQWDVSTVLHPLDRKHVDTI